ncbi:MAG TPA: hypothetical protein VHX63_02790 [Acidobacteriaceae bacterium]|jgi:Rod binding domain-containing protein|nr:hypothetical protein [Acidobacteriaceae bacterium]
MTQLSNLASLAAAPQPAKVAAKPSPRLRQAAVEFEANFLQELLKPMTHDPLFSGSNSLDGDDGEDGGSMGTVDSMGTEALATALAGAGGLGIAKQILAEMAPIEAANAAKTATNADPAGMHCGDCTQPLTMGQGDADPNMLALGTLPTEKLEPKVNASGEQQSVSRSAGQAPQDIRKIAPMTRILR